MRLLSTATSDTTFLSCIFRSASCQATSTQCVQLQETFSDLTIAQDSATMTFFLFYFLCVCVRAEECEWIFNEFWKHRLSIDRGFVAEDCRPTVLRCPAWFQRGPTCVLLLPSGTSRELQDDSKPLDPGRGMCFWSRFGGPATLRGPACVDVQSDGWTREEIRQLVKARKHIPPPRDAFARDTLHYLGPEKCVALP